MADITEGAITALPPKAAAILDGVMELIDREVDPSQLKVADIAAAAGVGKGTVYEYFSNKEEMIVKAIIYSFAVELAKLRRRLQEQTGFDGKMNIALDWIGENSQRKIFFIKLLHNSEVNGHTLFGYAQELNEGLLSAQGRRAVYWELIEAGVREKKFSPPSDPFQADSAVTAAVWIIINYWCGKSRYSTVAYEEVKAMAYDTFIFLLKR